MPPEAQLPNELIRTYVPANPGINSGQLLEGVEACRWRSGEVRAHPLVRCKQGLDFLAKFRIGGANFVEVARSQRWIELQRRVRRRS